MFKYIKSLFAPPTKEQLEEKLVCLVEDERNLRQIINSGNVPYDYVEQFRDVSVEIALIKHKLSKM